MIASDLPHRRLSSAHQNQKQALRELGLCQVFFGQFMFALPGLTMHKRNAFGFRISVDAISDLIFVPSDFRASVKDAIAKAGGRSPEGRNLVPKLDLTRYDK